MRLLAVWLLSGLCCAQPLVIEQGSSRLIDRAGVQEVLVANGDVAQIKPLNDSLALLLAKSVGQTELYFIQGQTITPATVQVLAPGTLLGSMQLRLMILEQAKTSSQAEGLDWGLQVQGESLNAQSSLSASSFLSWLPSAEQSGVRVLAQPRIRMHPTQPVQLKIGGEIERDGSDGAVEDKEYGMEVEAQYHWHGTQLALELSLVLRTPSSQGGFRRQSLTQQSLVDIAEVTEFARFDGLDTLQSQRMRGLPFSKNEGRHLATHWRVVGWFEPLEEHL